jgi:hypothetical protein
MSLIQAALQAVLPSNKKQTPSGWISFDAPCCHHRGETQDDRKRGGVMFTGDAFSYHCFNCGFKAGWSPGKLLSSNTRKLFNWMGIPDSEVSKLGLAALREQQDQPKVKKQFSFELEERTLPEDAKTLFDWACDTTDLTDSAKQNLIDVIQYIINRGLDPNNKNFWWSPAAGFRDRVIIPFYQDLKIVGYTGRKITEGKPKYLTDAQPGYVFNLTSQPYNRKFVIVVEGQFDAIAIDGCAIMHNEPNDTQVMRLNALGREIIVVPDRDRPGAKMLKSALDNNWTVSLPPWGDDVKDVADAVKQYGRLYTLTTILHYRTSNQIKIQLLKKKLEGLNG